MIKYLTEVYRRTQYLVNKDDIDQLDKCDILFICQDVDRGDFKNGLPYSKLIDSLHEELAGKSLTCRQMLLPPRSILSGNKSWANAKTANRSFFIAWNFGIIASAFKKISKSDILFRLLPNEEKCYYKILQKANPKLVFVIGAQRELCRAARKANIKVIELLHGIGYDDVKWGWENEPFENLPAVILSLDRVSTKSFIKLSQKGVKVFEIPHPWYKRFSRTNLELDTTLDPAWINRPPFLPIDKKIVLISLVWGYDGDHGPYYYFSNVLENGLLPNELVSVIEKTKDEIFWCIRRHPVQVRNKRYDYQIDFLNQFVKDHPNCEWELSTSCTLISQFLAVDAHVTMISMTSYDAAMMGIKSLLLCPTLHEGKENENLFNDLVESGYAVKYNFKEDVLLEWVKNVKKTEPYMLSDASDKEWNDFFIELYNS